MKLLAIALMVGLCVALVPHSASAAAYGASWQVSITYQNVGTDAASVSIDFYAEKSGTPITFSPGSLPKGAGTSLSVGSVTNLGSSFKGSAVLSANQPVIATIVQYASGLSTRLLSNGFSSSDGSSSQLVATVLKNTFGNSTFFSVQNTEASPVNVTVKYFAVGSTSAAATVTENALPAGAAKYFDVKDVTALADGFNGSAVVTAVMASDGTTAANIVVTVDELEVGGNGGKSFEGSSKSGAKVYMPSALCTYGGLYNTSYAVQNASTTDTVTFQVTYKQTGKADVVDGPYTLNPGSKQSIQGCTKLPAGAIGAAIVERTAGTGTLVAVGKVSGGSITSAFLGTVEGNGSAKVAAPYVRWSPDVTYNTGTRQRANIAVQNIGSADATNVKVQYYDKDGNLKGEHVLGTLAAGAKLSSSPAAANALDSCGAFGEYGDVAPGCLGTSFGGSAIVVADSGAQLAVVVRITSGSLAGEDYNGINAP